MSIDFARIVSANGSIYLTPTQSGGKKRTDAEFLRLGVPCELNRRVLEFARLAYFIPAKAEFRKARNRSPGRRRSSPCSPTESGAALCRKYPRPVSWTHETGFFSRGAAAHVLGRDDGTSDPSDWCCLPSLRTETLNGEPAIWQIGRAGRLTHDTGISGIRCSASDRLASLPGIAEGGLLSVSGRPPVEVGEDMAS